MSTGRTGSGAASALLPGLLPLAGLLLAGLLWGGVAWGQTPAPEAAPENPAAAPAVPSSEMPSVLPSAPASETPAPPAPQPSGAVATQGGLAGLKDVELYISFDELAALWKFRDAKTGKLPPEGTPEQERYRERWLALSHEIFLEARKRVPRRHNLVPAMTNELTTPLRLGLYLADVQTSCDAPTYYKYLWVRTWQKDGQFATNWDGLGVRSETTVDTRNPAEAVQRDGLRTWTEVWAQVPYLRIRERAAEDAPPSPAGPEAAPAPVSPVRPGG